MRKQIPNIITLLNLFCGCGALVNILYGDFLHAFSFIFIGGLADYSDGMVARWLNVKSPFGKELDSIADMVTFGVVPGAILYMLINFRLNAADVGDSLSNQLMMEQSFSWLALPAFFISAFAAIRLAKFNLDTRQSDQFIGLNTPACTMFVVGIMLIFHFDSFGLRPYVSNLYFLYALIPILSFLLVSELPMMAFKFKGLKWKGNERRFIFIFSGVVLIAILREVALSLVILIYILFSIFEYFFTPKSTT